MVFNIDSFNEMAFVESLVDQSNNECCMAFIIEIDNEYVKI